MHAKAADGPGLRPIQLDMEFAEDGGEGPTPYEVLLSAAMRGDSSNFARQDAVEETWRVVQPLLDSTRPSGLRAGHVGAGFGGRAHTRLRRLEEPVAAVNRKLTPWMYGVGAVTFLAGLLFGYDQGSLVTIGYKGKITCARPARMGCTRAALRRDPLGAPPRPVRRRCRPRGAPHTRGRWAFSSTSRSTA